MKILTLLVYSVFFLAVMEIRSQQPVYSDKIYGSQFQSYYSQNYAQSQYQQSKPNIYYNQSNYYDSPYSDPIFRVTPPLYHNPNSVDLNYNFLPPPPPIDYSFPDSSRTNQLYWYLQNT